MHTPTTEQQAILEAARGTRDNLMLSALAGCAKTSTLEMVARALTGAPILSVAFNKRIADEMTKRLPDHVMAKTLNSLGHGVWSKAIGRRLTLDAKKAYRLVRAEIEKLPRSERADEYERFADTMNLVRVARQSGYIPPLLFPEVKRLSEEVPVEEPLDRAQQRLLDEVLKHSIREAYDGTIDFDDQIYMPTLFGGPFPRPPLVMVDEAQDLSLINHRMLDRIVADRLIAVGDPWQSIYGFRGAVHSGMATIGRRYACRELPLTVTFRCPKAVVERARARVPAFRAADSAPEGEVRTLDEWTERDIPDGAAVICRNNAPLFRLALRLIRKGRGVTLPGRDIGAGLVRTLKKLGPESTARDTVHALIDQWETEQLKGAKSPSATHDRADCLRVFADAGPTLSAAVAYAAGLFAQEGPVTLLSIHKAKGLEWTDVWHLDPWRVPSRFAREGEEMEQELNCQYVCLTRTKARYTEFNMENDQ